MAAPPPAYSTPHTGNPDRRALPDGWITRYDDNYRAWYYVDTRTHPPRSSWEHPLGPLSSTPANSSFAPPAHPPPSRTGGAYNPSSSPPGSFPSSQPNQPYGQYNQQTQPYGYQTGTATHEPRAYQPPSAYPVQPPYGGNYGNPGTPGWPQQGWQQQPPTQLGYQTQPPSQAIQQPPRSGRNNALLAGGAGVGAGLLGGVLLTEAFEHHDDRERQEAYDEGFDNGQDSTEFGGGDIGGSDW